MSIVSIKIKRLKEILDDTSLNEKEKIEILDFFDSTNSITQSKDDFIKWLNKNVKYWRVILNLT